MFVKNEFPDFCSWMAWYFAIGVDTIVVYDDHSTDGTWEAAVAASRCLDVRPRRTDLAVQPFTARQREAYLGAAREFRDAFDWIGFLDADEFLHLRHQADLPSFLSRFPDAAAVAFSWCIYGSNGHLLKPAATTVEAFTRHSLPEFGHNRSVKTFARPACIVDRWRDPHTFEVGGRPYVDAQGEPVRWGGPGAIGHDPDWSSAKLMHFIPRSMEHFVERIRRRSDLQGMTNEYWNVFNKNDVEDREPLQTLSRTSPFLFMIDREIMRDYVDCLAASGLPSGQDALAQRSDRQRVAVSIVRTCFGTVLALDSGGRLVHLEQAALSARDCTAVVSVSRSHAPDAVILLAPHDGGPLSIPKDARLSSMLPFTVQHAPQDGSVRLRNPRSLRYLTVLPPAASGMGQTSADRLEANAWETFDLVPFEGSNDGLAGLPSLSLLVTEPPTVDLIVALARGGAEPAICAAGMQLLPAAERAQLDCRIPHILPTWV